MHPPSLPLYTWWIAAVFATVMFLLIFIPTMPNREYRLRACVMPAVIAVFGLLFALVKGMPLRVILPLYSAVVMAFVLGFLGRGRQLRERMARIDRGERLEGGMFAVVRTQLIVAMFAMAGISFWLASASM